MRKSRIEEAENENRNIAIKDYDYYYDSTDEGRAGHACTSTQKEGNWKSGAQIMTGCPDGWAEISRGRIWATKTKKTYSTRNKIKVVKTRAFASECATCCPGRTRDSERGLHALTVAFSRYNWSGQQREVCGQHVANRQKCAKWDQGHL